MKASGQQSKGRKRKQVLMSESDESGGEESPPDSGSDWNQAAASSDAADDEDDVSMADDESPGIGAKGLSSSKKRKKPAAVTVSDMGHAWAVLQLCYSCVTRGICPIAWIVHRYDDLQSPCALCSISTIV